MPNLNPNQLLVEGDEDCHAIAHLMRAYVDWPTEKHKRPVEIEVAGSYSEILNRPRLTAKLKSSELRRFGIVIDADEAPSGRWESLKNTFNDFFELPDRPPVEGWIGGSEDRRVGIWIMPDNCSNGMLENFLEYLVPVTSSALLDYAKSAVATAKDKGAPYSEAHEAKATIHTWLAWQDPPGEKFGIAITKRVLDPMSPAARPFVEWFARLFEMELKHIASESPSRRISENASRAIFDRVETAVVLAG